MNAPRSNAPPAAAAGASQRRPSAEAWALAKVVRGLRDRNRRLRYHVTFMSLMFLSRHAPTAHRAAEQVNRPECHPKVDAGEPLPLESWRCHSRRESACR